MPPGESESGATETDSESEYEILDQRVVSEQVVEETTEPTGAAALAPPTLGNAPWARMNHRQSPGIEGGVGLPHLSAAMVGIPGTLRLGITGEVFSTSDFLIGGDRASRQAMTFSGGYTFLDWLEVYGSAAFVTVTNSHSSPRLMQVQGDVALGAKGAWRLPHGISLGADLGLSLMPHIGSAGVGALGLAPRVLATFDARELPSELPILLHIDGGARLDGATPVESEQQLNRLEEFALDAHGYNRAAAGAGVEVPLPVATPFISWRMRAPLGEVVVPLVRDDSGEVRPVTYGEVVSHVLSIGARVTALRDVSFLAAVDLGLNGAAVQGVPATMPWNFIFGISYVLDPRGGGERTTRVVERVVEVDRAVPPPPETGLVAGSVTDAHQGNPLDGAVVRLSKEGSLPVASNESGRFLAHDLAPGEVEVTVEKEGYKPVTAQAVVSAGETATVDVSMERAVDPGILTLAVQGG
ncbi:MAG: carboxypeptidase-like regulatory domain-containing protein, partial [Myxococcota bacterium]